MITLKQLEALRWIVVLGSFEKAAERLHTTQSAVSKRIQELEGALGVAVFDRSQRGARLTLKGQEVLAAGEEMLALRDRLVATTSPVFRVRQLRFGVTELTALTWLPGFVESIRATFPDVSLEPEVEQSVDLLERLKKGTVDFIVVPDAFGSSGMRRYALAKVQNTWMCSPTLLGERGIIPLGELAKYNVLTQGNRSGSGILFERWLHDCGVQLPHVISSNSLVALVGMTIASIGISYLPERCFAGLINQGRLRAIETDPAIPTITYVVMMQADCPEPLAELIKHIAHAACDFSHPVGWS